MLPIELTNEDIRNSEAYKEYYAAVSGAAPPKTKASVRKTKSSFNTSITPLTTACTRSNRLRDEAQAEYEEFLKNLDENIQKIIKEQVKEQVKVQVSKILSKIKKTMNEQLEAEVLTRSSNSSKTSYAVAADLSEMELKEILIEKMESKKFIHRSDEQRNLDKALVEAYESDKIILDTYGDIVTLKRRAADDQPIAGASQHPEWFQKQKKPPTPNCN
nr:hypothetical protein [Tanacetum cinerariifolium]